MPLCLTGVPVLPSFWKRSWVRSSWLTISFSRSLNTSWRYLLSSGFHYSCWNVCCQPHCNSFMGNLSFLSGRWYLFCIWHSEAYYNVSRLLGIDFFLFIPLSRSCTIFISGFGFSISSGKVHHYLSKQCFSTILFILFFEVSD